jgi:hypothetical protein
MSPSTSQDNQTPSESYMGTPEKGHLTCACRDSKAQLYELDGQEVCEA